MLGTGRGNYCKKFAPIGFKEGIIFGLFPKKSANYTETEGKINRIYSGPEQTILQISA